jgi:hypothetical protein
MGIRYTYEAYQAKKPDPTPELYSRMKAVDLETLKSNLKKEEQDLIREREKSTEGSNRLIKNALKILGASALLGFLSFIIGQEEIATIFLLISAGAFVFAVIGCLPASNTQASWVDAAVERTDIFLRIHKLANQSTDFEQFRSKYENLHEETEDPDFLGRMGRKLGKKYMQAKNKSKH